jgi:hypothetical protein
MVHLESVTSHIQRLRQGSHTSRFALAGTVGLKTSGCVCVVGAVGFASAMPRNGRWV